MILVWRIWADYGHFSHPATIYSSLSYPLPPKTAVMGMLGAVCGEEAYWKFAPMRYGVRIERLEGKRRFCFNGIKEALSQLTPKKCCQGFAKGRKQFYRELLLSPAYTLFCDMSDVEEPLKTRVIEAMQAHKSYFPLYMGINACLAEYELIDIVSSSPLRHYKEALIDTAVPLESDFLIEEGKSYSDVRMATTVNEAREFGGFRDYLIETGGRGILCRNIEASEVGAWRVTWS